jgi:hypothetical protein
MKISDSIKVVELSKEMQISRQLNIENILKFQGEKKLLISGCSHALVFTNWKFTGELRAGSLYNTLDKIFNNKLYKTQLDSLIGAIRVITGIDIGYYQIFANPKGWVRHWKANYIKLITAYDKKYPVDYEDFKWLENPYSITKKEPFSIKKTFKLIQSNKSKKVKFAISKLNSIVTRKNNEDIVFDVTVALESMLSNDSHSEITYRLSTRGAYISSIDCYKKYKPSDIKLLLNKLYNYRSGVAHGKSKEALLKINSVEINNEKIDLLQFSIEFLRFTISFFLNYSKLNDLKELDKHYLDNTLCNKR